MVKKKGMKSCGDEWKTVYNPNKRITLEKEFCINGYLLYSIIKGLFWKRLLLENGCWLIVETKEKNFKVKNFDIELCLYLHCRIK